VRERMLSLLSRSAVPVTLSAICRSAGLLGEYDDATVYRTLVLLVEIEVARQVQIQGRATHFLLNSPGECFSFLVCRCCGAITPIPHGKELRAVEERMTVLHGYTSVTHELELYGTCPKCRVHVERCVKPSKLCSGMRLRRRSAK